MPNLSLTKIWNYLAATTFERIAPFIADNITNRIFLLHILDQAGQKQRVNGGLNLVFPVLKELPTAQAYSDMGNLDVSRADPATVAVYNWKQIAAPVTISGRDMLINSGSDVAIQKALRLFIEAAELSVRNALADATTGIFSSNDEDAAGITGLQNLITHTSNATPTSGTAGNLSRATYTFWRNQVADVADDFSANGYYRMHDLYTLCTRGDETPNVICLTRATYLNFLRNATSTIRYNTPQQPATAVEGTLNVGWGNVTFLGATMGYDDACPADNGYMLNCKYVNWVCHTLRELELGPFVIPQTQDSISAHIFFAGNLCINNMARQGLLRRGDTD